MTFRHFTSIACAVAALVISCNNKTPEWVGAALESSTGQLLSTADTLRDSGRFPRSIWSGWDIEFLAEQIGPSVYAKVDSLRPQPSADKLGKLRTCDVYDWTSGFFPGSLWLAYELTGDERLLLDAVDYTNKMLPATFYTGTHDLGFMVGCSYGNALRLCPNDSLKTVIIRTADNLASRFNPEIGAIRSWDFGPWNFPVIIDNMMNLELLFKVSEMTGDPVYRNIAISHADKTLENHYRDDFSTYHVVDYDDETGAIRRRCTAQGIADESRWARGQAWSIYGFTVAYRFTRDERYLQRAKDVANYLFVTEDNMPEDLVPLWDFDVKEFSAQMPEPDYYERYGQIRDASSAAIICSALYELYWDTKDEFYKAKADKIVESLSSPAYRAKPGTNGGFILMHSVGSIPHGSSIDVPLNYADYYFLESLLRKRKIEAGNSPVE